MVRPSGVAVEPVAEPVGAQVQARARADLQQYHRKWRPGCHVQQSAEQCRGPAHLVGLRCLVQAGADRLQVVLDGRGPCLPYVGARCPADARVVTGQNRRSALQDQPVHGAEQPQAQRGRTRVGFVPGQRTGHHAAACDVVARPLEQVRVQR